MDLTPTSRAKDYLTRLEEFMTYLVYPVEAVYEEQTAAHRAGGPPSTVLAELKTEARKRGLWNLFLPDPRFGPGLSTLEYAPLAEVIGRSPNLASSALNCSAPDTGNMEILAQFGTADMRERWLGPLLDDEIRSVFMMTEPDVASSDATNIATRIERDGDEYVITGRKWWITGAYDPRCAVAIVMGVTNPDAAPHRRHSLVVVPWDTPGIEVVRSLDAFGFDNIGSPHAEVLLHDVRVPVSNLLGEEGGGFAVGQGRMGPARVHLCMRAIGMAERAFDLMCERAVSRVAFGAPLADQGVVRQWIAEARVRIDQARLLTLAAAWKIDTAGTQAARAEISAIKIAAPEVATWVIDRAIQVYGGAGVSRDVPLSFLYAMARVMRIADGPDEVHKHVLARHELRRYRS